MKTLLKAEIILLLACLLYCFAPLHCEAANYTITEAELTQLENNLTQLEAIIENAAGTAGRSEEAINNADAAAERIESGQREAAAIIADCQSIVRGVRARGKSKTAQP